MTILNRDDTYEVVHRSLRRENRSNADVVQVAHDDVILTDYVGEAPYEVVRQNVVQVGVRSRPIVQIFESGNFGGGALADVDFAVRDTNDPSIIYGANSSAALGSKNPAAAEWQIFRYDSDDDPLVFTWADGDQLFDNILDSGSKEYEGYSYS